MIVIMRYKKGKELSGHIKMNFEPTTADYYKKINRILAGEDDTEYEEKYYATERVMVPKNDTSNEGTRE